MSIVTILGAGELGGCIGRLLQKKTDTVVQHWDADPSRNPEQKPLTETVPQSDAIFLCIPSGAYRAALSACSDAGLRKETPIVSFAKGIDLQSKATLDQTLAETLGNDRLFALISGPMLAEEIDEGLPAAAVCATKDKKLFDFIESLFLNSGLRFEYSNDVRGVALAGVLKNVYAILLGALDGASLGSNTRGALITAALGEMASCIDRLGGKRETAYTLAGIGDLIATGSSTYSRNYSVGRELATTGVCTGTSEGTSSVRAVRALDGIDVDAPLLEVCEQILECKIAPKSALLSLI